MYWLYFQGTNFCTSKRCSISPKLGDLNTYLNSNCNLDLQWGVEMFHLHFEGWWWWHGDQQLTPAVECNLIAEGPEKLEPEDFRCEDSCPLQRQIWNEWNGLSNHNSKQQSINGQNTEMSWPVLRCQSATLWFKIWDFPHFPWPFRGSYFGMFQHCMVSWFEWFVVSSSFAQLISSCTAARSPSDVTLALPF